MRSSADILKEMDAIVATASNEQRDMTAAEVAEFDKLEAEYNKALEAEAEAATRAAESTASRTAQLAAAHDRANASRTVQPPRRPISAPSIQAKEFESLAEFCEAAVCNQRDPRLASLYRERDADPRDRRGSQNMGTGSQGGFLIPTQFRNQLLQTEVQGAIIRPRATVIPAGDPPDSGITMPALDQTVETHGAGFQRVDAGVVVNWIAEGGAKPPTEYKLKQISLEPQEVAGYIPVTDKALRNSAAIGALVAQLLPRALMRAEERAFLNGDGVGKPKGVLGAACVYVSPVSGAGLYADLVEAESRLLTESGVWIINKRLKPTIKLLKDDSGGSPGVGAYIFSEVTNTLLGHPVVWSTRSPAKGQQGDILLADLSYYLIKDGSGPFIAASEHVGFVNNMTYIKAFSNVDGRSWMNEPFTQEDGSIESPFVVLAAGAR